TGNRKRVAADLLHINGHFPCRLDGVGMEEDVSFARNFANRFNRLYHACFIVGHHYANEPGIWPHRLANVIGIEFTPSIHWNVGHLTAHLLQTLASVEHCAVLDGGSDHMIAALSEAKDGRVIAFCPAAGKNNFRWTSLEEGCHRGSGLLYRGARVLPIMVNR